MKRRLRKINPKGNSRAFLIGITLLMPFTIYAQTITTIAGTGTAGYNSDGILATAAELNQPSGVVVDKNGNIYIADNINNRIRKIDASTGDITTIAGNGTAGYNGDGIAATAAELYQPWEVSLDNAGNLYISDWGNARIRKVTISTGIITTIAGTGTAGYNGDGVLATAAELNHPGSTTIDKNGNIYISDNSNQRIRMVNAAGYISTVAGTGTAGYNGDGILATAAEVNFSASVALDTAGNLFIADYYNNEIRKVTTSTGIITCVAGTETAGYTGDGILATTSELNNPSGVFIGPGQSIYIADHGNNRIRKVNITTGMISTVAGDGTAGYNGDGISATSAEINTPYTVTLTNNDLYIAEFAGNRVRKVTLDVTGIENISNEFNVAVYPNPVVQTMTIQLDGTTGKTNFTLFNSLGQQVLQKYSTEKNTNISVANLSSGIYFLQIANQDGSKLTKKISVIR